MDYGREHGFSNSNVVQILTGNSGANENWSPGPNDQAIWSTEDEYGMWNGDLNYDATLSQSRSGSEPSNKRSRNSQSGGDFTSSNRSRAIGKMFYKTKLCCKFRMGTCPYITNCNFAHTNEELRKPPPNWQEIVAANDDERDSPSELREEFQIPILGVSDDTQRSFKFRHCKKFYTDEGCPYGENCTFLHDEQSKSRESVAISLGPGSGGGYGGNVSGSILKPSNWKTRICNKWEITGYCPFGSKCHFAHGAAELHQYGGPFDPKVIDSSTPDAKQGGLPLKNSTDPVVASLTSVPHSDGYHIGVPSQRVSNVMQKNGQKRPTQKWKGPDKISIIYGDWIEDLE